MLLSTLLGIAAFQTQEPLRWVGEARAFAIYLDETLTPFERLGTAYVARKRYEDGSSVTTVRVTPTPQPIPVHLFWYGGGRIERDSSGRATRIVASQDRIPTVDPQGRRWPGIQVSAYDFKVSPEEPDGPLRGRAYQPETPDHSLVLTDRSRYLLDPLEGIAFGPNPRAGGFWSFPNPYLNTLPTQSTNSGSRWWLRPGLQTALNLGAREKSELFNPVRMIREWVGSPKAPSATVAGTLLYRLDGTLAAFIPMQAMDNLPSMAGWAGNYSRPTVPRKAGTESAPSINFPPTPQGVYIPVPLSRSQQNGIVSQIADPA